MFYNKKWIVFCPEDSKETQTREISLKGILVMAKTCPRNSITEKFKNQYQN